MPPNALEPLVRDVTAESVVDSNAIARAAAMINQAKKPIFIVGQGCANDGAWQAVFLTAFARPSTAGIDQDTHLGLLFEPVITAACKV